MEGALMTQWHRGYGDLWQVIRCLMAGAVVAQWQGLWWLIGRGCDDSMVGAVATYGRGCGGAMAGAVVAQL